MYCTVYGPFALVFQQNSLICIYDASIYILRFSSVNLQSSPIVTKPHPIQVQ